jgi:epoxyqueuosine reductase QueG
MEVLQGTVPLDQRKQIGEDISVVCWVLPFAERIRSSNAMKSGLPASPLWSHGQEYGEKFNDYLRQQVVQFLASKGYLAVAPMRSPLYVKLSRYVTNWSERHALYAAGMGTFSLSGWFITERGMAMRCASVVVNARLTPTPRCYTSHTENCPFYSHGTCGKCIDRCPAKAITTNGLNKPQCREYLDQHSKRSLPLQYCILLTLSSSGCTI